MKNTKLARSLLIALSLTMATNITKSMDRIPTYNSLMTTSIAIIGSILLGKIAIQALWQQPESFPFTDLPTDIQKEIITLITIGTTSNNLKEAGSAIKALCLVNKQLYELLNNKVFVSKLINHLSNKFNTDYKSTAEAIGTQMAKELAKNYVTLQFPEPFLY